MDDAERARSLEFVRRRGSSAQESWQHTREKFREQLRDGRLDHRSVEIDVRERAFPSFEVITGSSIEEIDINIKDMLPGLIQGRTRKRRMKVPEAFDYLVQEEESKLVDMDSVARVAVERVEQSGIIFVDEIDKIAGREGGGQGPDVSREGVQRDILPIIEGTTVNSKYGMVRTDHILFIAAGAFHVSKPSDLIPELQGRFPIRVELEPLGKDDFVRILTEPKNALVKQYIALMETEGITLRFLDEAIDRIADFATLVNERTENIGARRLHTVMERLLDEISFEGPDLRDKDHHDRRRVRRADARGHRQERRSLALHPVNSPVHETRGISHETERSDSGILFVCALCPLWFGTGLRPERAAACAHRLRAAAGERAHGQAGRRRHRSSVQGSRSEHRRLGPGGSGAHGGVRAYRPAAGAGGLPEVRHARAVDRGEAAAFGARRCDERRSRVQRACQARSAERERRAAEGQAKAECGAARRAGAGRRACARR